MNKQLSTAGAGVSLSRRRTRRHRVRTPFSGVLAGTIAANLRHQRSSVRPDELSEPDFGREAELQEVIEQVEARLVKLRRINTPDVFEEKLGRIEAVAAPYAIALIYEVRRLERLLREPQQRTVRSARHSTFAIERRRTRRGTPKGGA